MLALSARQQHHLATWGSSAALVPVCAYFVLVDYGTPGTAGLPWFLVHSLNLIPHEAGHFFFRFFGEWMMYAGGSIMQLVFPGLFVWYFLSNDGKLGLQVALVWLGQNLVDVSVYAADAQARAMPLIGGLGAENHDWWNLLILQGWLHHTPVIAGTIFALAFPVWALALAAPRWVS
jgi:hypothetical protein